MNLPLFNGHPVLKQESVKHKTAIHKSTASTSHLLIYVVYQYVTTLKTEKLSEENKSSFELKKIKLPVLTHFLVAWN